MDERLIERIRENLEAKDTAELVEIFKQHDRKRWSEEAFEAIKQILVNRGEAIPDIPVELHLEEKILLEKPIKKEKSGCLKLFLVLTGFFTFLRGFFTLAAQFSKSFNLWLFLLGLSMFLFGMITLYCGFNIRKAVTKMIKLIYTVVITQALGSLIYIIYKFDLFLEPMDIALSIFNILIAWAVLLTALNLRKEFLKAEAYLPESEMQGLEKNRKKVNRSFLIVIAIIIVLGILKIGFFPTASIQKAFMLIMVGDFKKAQMEFELVLAKNPDDKDALIGAGICHGALKNSGKAKEYFEIALKKYSAEPLLFLQIANIANHALENYDWAIELLNQGHAKVQKSGPEFEYFSRRYFENMGWAYYKKGEMEEAKQYFAKAMPFWNKFMKNDDFSGDITETHFYMGIYFRLVGDLPAAKEHLDKVLTISKEPLFTDLAKKELAKIPDKNKK